MFYNVSVLIITDAITLQSRPGFFCALCSEEKTTRLAVSTGGPEVSINQVLEMSASGKKASCKSTAARPRVVYCRAMLCMRGICYGPVSVSVTRRCSTKTAKHSNTQTRPHDSSGTLVF